VACGKRVFVAVTRRRTHHVRRGLGNKLFKMVVKRNKLKAVVAFGNQAEEALKLAEGIFEAETLKLIVPHPSSHDETVLLNKWREAVTEINAKLGAGDRDVDTLPANYGTAFTEADYAPVPRYDLPWGVPDFLGDDSRGRAANPPRRSQGSRPQQDDQRTLIWKIP
jgi:hypothetical protein